MFRFAAEQMLFAYVVIPVLVGLAWWAHVRRCRDLLLIADPTLLERLTSTVNRPGRMAKTVLYVMAVGLLATCLLYTSDAADDLTRVDLGGRRII